MVRRRILVLVGAALFFIAVMIGVMALALSTADGLIRRADAMQGRFEAISALNGGANAYGKEVALMLLLGRARLANLTQARLEMENVFVRLTRATRDEISMLSGVTEIEAQLPDLETTRRMLELYHTIDASANQAISQQRAGQYDQALDTLNREVVFRLANELQPIIDKSLQDERGEIASQQANADQQRLTFAIGGAIVAALSLLALGLLGRQLWREIIPPVGALSAGVTAVAAGDLGKRLPDGRKGELGELLRGFNAMVEAIAGRTNAAAQTAERLSSDLDSRSRQLRDASERLRTIDLRRGQFLADVSHELRTPLTVLRGEADVALRGRGDAGDLKQSLDRISGQANDMARLLDDLIAFARSDVENQSLALAEVRVDDVIAAAAQEGEVLAEPREVAIVLDLRDDNARVEADFRRLKQALMIGLDNAVKHSPPGSKIGVLAARGDSSVTLQITDEGVGVDEADLPRVFERFYRGRHEGELQNEGFGIGLAVARDIVERHGGTIELANRSEGGAVLSITLPLVQGAAE